MKKENG